MTSHHPGSICHHLPSGFQQQPSNQCVVPGLATPACCLHGQQSDSLKPEFRPLLCSGPSRCWPFQWFTRPFIIFSHSWLFWSCLLLHLLSLVYSAPALPGLLLFLKSQACPCPGIFAQAISCSNLSPNLHLAYSLSSLGLSKYPLPVKLSLITLFKIITPSQPLGRPILFSCFICSIYCQLTPSIYYSFLYWPSFPLECSSLEGRDFCISFIAMSLVS